MEKYREIKKTINKIIREKKRFPSLQEMCNILHYTEDQTKKYMEALAEDGYLEKNGDWYRYPEKEPITNEIENVTVPEEFVKEIDEPLIVEKDILGEEIDRILDEPIEVPIVKKKKFKLGKRFIRPFVSYEESDDPSFKKKPRIKRSKQQKYSAPIYIIQILMGIIGIGASIISTYYTTIWLLEFLPWGFALMLSAIMVGFAVSAFETIILFLSGQVTQNNIAKWSITLGFIILWMSVTFFSIFSTIAGQYNKFVLNLKEEAKQGIDIGKVEWNSLQEHKGDLRERLKEYRENVKTYTEISRTMTKLDNRTENDKTWAENQYRLRKANEEVRLILDQLNSIRIKETKLMEESKNKGIILGVTEDTENIVNFYGWLAKVVGIDKDRAQFFMSLLPAIFVDFLAPVGIALALFLRNKYKN